MPELTLVEERGGAAEIRELEELLAASPAPVRRVLRLRGLVAHHLGKLVALLWVVFLVSVAFQPAPDPEAVTPLWADLVVAGFFLSLGTAGLTGWLRSARGGFAASTVAGLFGVTIAVGCLATDHHPGSWWAYELGATALLLGVSVLCLRRSSRPGEASLAPTRG